MTSFSTLWELCLGRRWHQWTVLRSRWILDSVKPLIIQRFALLYVCPFVTHKYSKEREKLNACAFGRFRRSSLSFHQQISVISSHSLWKDFVKMIKSRSSPCWISSCVWIMKQLNGFSLLTFTCHYTKAILFIPTCWFTFAFLNDKFYYCSYYCITCQNTLLSIFVSYEMFWYMLIISLGTDVE